MRGAAATGRRGGRSGVGRWARGGWAASKAVGGAARRAAGAGGSAAWCGVSDAVACRTCGEERLGNTEGVAAGLGVGWAPLPVL